MSDETGTKVGAGDGDQQMKSSLLDDDDDVKMSGVTQNQERMADEAEQRDHEAAQIKQMSAGQSFESGPLISSQSQAQAAGSNAPIEIRKK